MIHKPVYLEDLRAPVNVTWEVTARCNLRCRHCLSADILSNGAFELDLGQCFDFIDELKRIGVFQINFGGGEPFLRKDFLDILAYAHSKGITTCVSTNGTVLDENLVKEMKRMDLLRIQVSLDGATAATNDSIRGVGTFEKILVGIEYFIKHKFSHLSINTVVTRTNFNELEELCKLAGYYGVKTRFSRFRPAGRAREVWQDYHLSNRQLAKLSEFLSVHREILTGDSFFPIINENERHMALNICGAARMTCSVLPDGSVYPCAFLQDESFKGGNILRESLETIWLHAPAFRMLREVRVDACRDCLRFSSCHGGCRAVAYYTTKSLGQPDPECLPALHAKVFHHVGTV